MPVLGEWVSWDDVHLFFGNGKAWLRKIGYATKPVTLSRDGAYDPLL